MALSQLGYEVEHGAGVGAAQRVFVEAGVAAPRRKRVLEQQYKVLVKEKIADSGVNMLRERFSVDVGVDWTDEELAERIGGYHGILIRSATQLTADLIERADNLRVIGRAGIGVDNVDVEAATKRGIIVANAPQSNIVAAAEHTVALMLASRATSRRRTPASPPASGSARSSAASRSTRRRSASSASAASASSWPPARRASACASWPSTRSCPPSASASSGSRSADESSDVYREADFITIHLPKTPETRGWLDAEAFAQMKDGVRVINCARGELLVDEALKDALDSGKVAGAALDVFPAEPITDYPLFDGYANVVVTPHLGASTTEAQDRAGVQTAEQVVAALTGGVVSTAVNIPAVSAEDMEVLGPYLPLVQRLGRLATALAEGASIERVECEYLGHLAGRDTRLLTLATLQRRARRPHRGGGQPRQRALAGRGARDRGRRDQGARGARLHRPRPHHGRRQRAWSAPRSASATARTCSRPGASASTSSSTTTTSRCSATPTCPAWWAASAPCFGEHGINISQAAVGREPPGEDGHRDNVAVMAVTTDAPGAAGGGRRDRRERRLRRRPRRLALVSASRPGSVGPRISR